MQEEETPRSLLLAALRGERRSRLPVAPLYLSLYFAPRIERLVAKAYEAKLKASRVGQIEVEFEEFVELNRLAMAEMAETHLQGCAWLPLRRNATRREIEGRHIRLQGEDLLWIEPDGTARDMLRPPKPANRDIWEAPEETRDRATWGKVPSASELLSSGEYLAAEGLAKRYKGTFALNGSMGAPFWLCYSKLGFGRLMTAVLEDPALVRDMAEFSLATVLEMVRAYKALGAEVIFIEECMASADLISPRQYEEFALPYEQRLLQGIRDEGLLSVFYFCGDVMPLLPMMRELPWDAFAAEESKKGFEVEIGKVRQGLGQTRTLFANIAAVLVNDGSPEEIEAEARRQAEAALPGPFVISIGSPFTLDTPVDRVQFFCRLGERLGSIW